MSTRANTSKEKSPITKNSFPLYQIKKMIGKKLIIPWTSLTITIQDRNSAKLMKAKILEASSADGKKVKNLLLVATCNNGVLQVFKNIDAFLAINSISYKELNNGVGSNINVLIHQYPKLSKNEIRTLL